MARGGSKKKGGKRKSRSSTHGKAASIPEDAGDASVVRCAQVAVLRGALRATEEDSERLRRENTYLKRQNTNLRQEVLSLRIAVDRAHERCRDSEWHAGLKELGLIEKLIASGQLLPSLPAFCSERSDANANANANLEAKQPSDARSENARNSGISTKLPPAALSQNTRNGEPGDEQPSAAFSDNGQGPSSEVARFVESSTEMDGSSAITDSSHTVSLPSEASFDLDIAISEDYSEDDECIVESDNALNDTDAAAAFHYADTFDSGGNLGIAHRRSNATSAIAAGQAIACSVDGASVSKTGSKADAVSITAASASADNGCNSSASAFAPLSATGSGSSGLADPAASVPMTGTAADAVASPKKKATRPTTSKQTSSAIIGRMAKLIKSKYDVIKESIAHTQRLRQQAKEELEGAEDRIRKLVTESDAAATMLAHVHARLSLLHAEDLKQEVEQHFDTHGWPAEVFQEASFAISGE